MSDAATAKTEAPIDPRRAIGFPASPVLPGESKAEFTRLFSELARQYRPEGPDEADAVWTMATAIWRKRHLDIFQRAAEARLWFGNLFEYPNDTRGITRLVAQGFKELAEVIDEVAEITGNKRPDGNENAADVQIMLSKGLQEEINNKFVGLKLQGAPLDDALLGSLAHDIQSQLEPIFGRATDEQLARHSDKANLVFLAQMGDLLTPERYEAELRLIAQLDATIDRSRKRLMEGKRARQQCKQMRHLNPLIPGWVKRNT